MLSRRKWRVGLHWCGHEDLHEVDGQRVGTGDYSLRSGCWDDYPGVGDCLPGPSRDRVSLGSVLDRSRTLNPPYSVSLIRRIVEVDSPP